MTRDEALAVLTKLKPQLQKQFGVSELALFGSAARDELRPDSDIDVLVKFDAVATSMRYFGVQFVIEDAMGMPVDLVTENALRRELRPYVDENTFVSERACKLYTNHVLGADTVADLDFLVAQSGTPVWCESC